MGNKINIAELLKDCPSGMELDCAMYDSAQLNVVMDGNTYPIKIQTPDGIISLTKDGCHSLNPHCKCVIFPKGKTTWEGFVPPCQFKDGDIIFTYTDGFKIGLGYTWISIFEENRNGGVATYVDYCNECKDFYTFFDDKGLLCMKEDIIRQRLATEEEKQKLFKAIEDNGYKWNPESKTLEELSPNFRECSDNEPLDIPTMTTEFVKEHGLPCPNGYIFKDENGNIIKATKIVLEKIKRKYPKTYKECFEVLCPEEPLVQPTGYWHKWGLLAELSKLLLCRDAYWKIAGEEMGLGKSWKPDWRSEEKKYIIGYYNEEIIKDYSWLQNTILAFPTKEMRDTFYENFKDLIKQCKELL